MKKAGLFLCFIIFYISPAFAKQCFIVKEKDKIIQQEGDCNQRYAPCSTFKIALSLIGYDSGILIDEIHPLWSFKKGYPDFLEVWKQDQTPKSWMKNSCVTRFNYGNMDLSGDKDKNNGLTNSWLSSSLEISSIEQIAFLGKLLNNTLPVSIQAHEMTKNILFVEELPGGWKLYGKTGSGVLLSPDRTRKLKIQHGWFIGWIEKDGRVIAFSNHISDDKKQNTFAGQRAKADVKERLVKIINDSSR